MPPKKLPDPGDTRVVPPTQHHRKILRDLLASVDWKNNPPLKISETISLGLGPDFALTASAKTEAQLFGKSLHAAHQRIERRGRDGRGRPHL